MLGKVFKMSGLYKGEGRMLEPDTHFRRALNVWQDRNGKYRAKGEQEAFYLPSSPYADPLIVRNGFTRRFKDGLFSCFPSFYDFTAEGYNPIYSANFFTYCDKLGNNVPLDYNTGAALQQNYDEYTMGRNTYPNTVVGDKLFFRAGTLPLLKFDGVQVVRAGLPLPWIKCAQYSTLGTRWVKVIHVRIGFDGRLVASGTVKFPTNSANITLDMSYSGSEIIGSSSVSPEFRDAPRASTALMDDMAWMTRNTGVAWTSGTGTMICTALDHNLEVGDWLMYHHPSATSLNWHIIALKVTNVAGLVITFSSTAKKYLKSTLSWVEEEVTPLDDPFNGGLSMNTWGSTVQQVYSSATENGAYLLASQLTLHGRESVGYTHIIPALATPITATFAGQTTQDIAGWYDIGTVKIPFPYQSPSILEQGILGLTNYQDQLLSYDKNAIYFSDFTSGGSDEMISGLSNFVPIGSEHGDIVSVEGCEDFLFISRERKNYVLVGDIATGNATVKECDTENLGAFSSNSALAVKGGIVFVNRQGVFFTNSAGTITEVSKDISRLFGVTRDFTTDPDGVTFKPYLMSDVVEGTQFSLAGAGWDGNIIRMKYDPDRNLLAILYAKKYLMTTDGVDDSYATIAINLSNGAVYEWKRNKSGGNDVPVGDIEFLPHYVAATGKFKGSLIEAHQTLTREDNTVAKAQDMYLISSWQTGGEPSLEKQLKQLKFYGLMGSCYVFHQEGWENFTTRAAIVAPRTNVLYNAPVSVLQFEHKQRLNTSRAQCYSVGIEPLGLDFTLEGFELEWELIQEGTKK